jgi:hypothetical protein
MRETQSVSPPAADERAAASELEALRAARESQAHVIHSLTDTILIYRRGASELAAEIMELRHALANARALHTRVRARDAQREIEITLASDEDASAVVSLAVGEALSGDYTADTVEACQTIASELTDQTWLRHSASDDAMLLLRIKHSPTAIGIEIFPA